MPLAFGGQFAKTIIERHEVEGRGEQKSRAQRAGEEHLQIEIEERSRSKKVASPWMWSVQERARRRPQMTPKMGR